jgi:Ser-tRNA(Ala) deacylase AlaX
VIDDEAVQVELDRSSFHPQGGGQPTDIGTIDYAGEQKSMSVSKVTLDRETGVVTHEGKGETFQVGDAVTVSVDADRRRILSECHTAGHVVDSAMARCDSVLPANKGYHFLDGPYVEYKGSIPAEERERLLTNLKQAFADLVEEDIATKIETLSREEAELVCNRVQQNFDLSEFSKGDAPLRIVTVAGWPCPCGGTHVQSTAELKERGWGITGLKSKKGVVRVKYGPSSNA